MPRLSGIKWETMCKRYGKRMLAAMKELHESLKEDVPASNPGEPWVMDADDYWVILTCKPEGKEGFDISFRLDDSNEYEGEPGGYQFSIELVEYGGRILGGFSPYNYTPKVWCTNFKDIDERFQLVYENIDEVVYHVEKLIKEGTLTPKQYHD